MSGRARERFSDKGKPNLAPGAVTARRGPRDARRRCGGVYGRATPALRHPAAAFSSCLSRHSHLDCRARRGLEQDVDFDNAMHGRQGPVPIRRVPPTQWDHFTQAVGEVWSQQGHAFIDDMNGQFGDGYAAVPFSNDGHNRWSTARSYLTETVRGRANLEIWDRTEVTRILFEQGRATGVEAVRDGHSISLDAQTVI